jgi:hypothetical protein
MGDTATPSSHGGLPRDVLVMCGVDERLLGIDCQHAATIAEKMQHAACPLEAIRSLEVLPDQSVNFH